MGRDVGLLRVRVAVNGVGRQRRFDSLGLERDIRPGLPSKPLRPGVPVIMCARVRSQLCPVVTLRPRRMWHTEQLFRSQRLFLLLHVRVRCE